MKSNNPVFARNEEFNRPSYGYGTQTMPGHGQDAYGDPSQWGTGAPGQPVAGRMTIDSVVQRTAITLAIVIAVAAATWWWIGTVAVTDNVVDASAVSRATTASLVGAGVAFVLSLVNSFKRVISPALVIAFAVFEGVALGGLSKMYDMAFPQAPGLVMNAVLGTFAAFAGTLAAYKFLNIKVGDKFRKGVVAGMFGMVGLGLLSLVLSLFGVQTGLFGFGALGLVTAVAGLALGVFMLILDFDFVEQGIAAGLDERESWRCAFGLLVSLVWIYTNLLRIMAIFSSDD